MGEKSITIKKDVPLTKELISKLYSRLEPSKYAEDLRNRIEQLEEKKHEYSELCCDTPLISDIQLEINRLQDELSELQNNGYIEPKDTKELWFAIDKLDIPMRQIHGSALTNDGLQDMILGTATDSVFANILHKYNNGKNLFLFKTYSGQIVSVSRELSLISEDNLKERIRSIIHGKEELSSSISKKKKPVFYATRTSGKIIVKDKKEYGYSREELSKRDLKSAIDKAVDMIIQSGSS